MRSLRLIVLVLISLSVQANAPAPSAHHFAFEGSDIHLVWYSEFTPQSKERLIKWIKSGLNLVRHLNGKLPRKEMRFHIQQKPSSESPVPYAQVLRDGMPGVHFWVDDRYSDYDLLRDWTFPHELVHLFIDYPGDKDIWLSEGLATYYQNILLVRGGLLNERDFWRRFIAGLKRGKHDSDYDGYPLESVSEHMRSIRSYMRVYWSGALFFLEGNLALLEKKKPSLDNVLFDFLSCCQNKSQYLDGVELIKKFDELAKTNWFKKKYKTYRYIDRMPEYEPLLEKLGVQMRGNYLYLEPNNKMRRLLLFGR